MFTFLFHLNFERYLDEIGHDDDSFSKLNFFYTLELLAKNPLGREIAWNYYRFLQDLITTGKI